MTPHSLSPHVLATVERIRGLDVPPLDKAEALVDVATDLQKQPKDPRELWDAAYYYGQAVDLAAGDRLATARARAGRGSALRQLPGSGVEALVEAREDFMAALAVLREEGGDEEVAEVEMSLGLVLQSLASVGKAPLTDAISAYHRALRTFGAETFPREYATLHNNLATAYLSMKLSPERDKMREAMAVQSFREALKVVTLLDDPAEYAMLQNNLGNALQSVGSAHRLANLARALEAYDEALKVRTAHDMPIEYANTVTNKANALLNLPDDAEHPELGNPVNLAEAIRLLDAAAVVFSEHGYLDRAEVVTSLASNLKAEMAGAKPS